MARKHVDRFTDILISKLKPHPANQELYRQRTPEERDDLARDMEKNGQTEAVEVTEDLTIISGHGRLEAAKQLGWKTLRCWVRSDLSDPDAVEARLVEANLHRRQLSRLDLIRSYRHLKRLQTGCFGDSLKDRREVKGDLRDLIAERFGLSGRSLDRWNQVLDLPMPLQEATDKGTLKLTEALKVAALPEEDQERIAEEIGSGKQVADVLARHLYMAPVEALTASRALDRLLEGLGRARKDLGGRVDAIDRIDFRNELGQLRDGKNLITALIARIKANKRRAKSKSQPWR